MTTTFPASAGEARTITAPLWTYYDMAGLRHLWPHVGTHVSVALAMALELCAAQPAPTWLWFNDVPAPIYPGDTLETWGARYDAWRADPRAPLEHLRTDARALGPVHDPLPVEPRPGPGPGRVPAPVLSAAALQTQRRRLEAELVVVQEALQVEAGRAMADALLSGDWRVYRLRRSWRMAPRDCSNMRLVEQFHAMLGPDPRTWCGVQAVVGPFRLGVEYAERTRIGLNITVPNEDGDVGTRLHLAVLDPALRPVIVGADLFPLLEKTLLAAIRREDKTQGRKVRRVQCRDALAAVRAVRAEVQAAQATVAEVAGG